MLQNFEPVDFSCLFLIFQGSSTRLKETLLTGYREEIWYIMQICLKIELETQCWKTSSRDTSEKALLSVLYMYM